MAFAGDEEVMVTIEELIYFIGQKCMSENWLPSPRIPRITYQEAMTAYGSDKPDRRLGMEV
jgi:aspartyl-tRNA synthetase